MGAIKHRADVLLEGTYFQREAPLAPVGPELPGAATRGEQGRSDASGRAGTPCRRHCKSSQGERASERNARREKYRRSRPRFQLRSLARTIKKSSRERRATEQERGRGRGETLPQQQSARAVPCSSPEPSIVTLDARCPRRGIFLTSSRPRGPIQSKHRHETPPHGITSKEIPCGVVPGHISRKIDWPWRRFVQEPSIRKVTHEAYEYPGRRCM